MGQFNKVDQDNNLLKKEYKKKVKQNQVDKAKICTKDMGTKAIKVGKNQSGKQQ